MWNHTQHRRNTGVEHGDSSKTQWCVGTHLKEIRRLTVATSAWTIENDGRTDTRLNHTLTALEAKNATWGDVGRD